MTAIAAELPAEVLPATHDASAEDWGSWHANDATGSDASAAGLDDDDARKIRQLRAEGLSRRELAEAWNVSMATIGRVLAGQTYPDAIPLPEVLDDELHDLVVNEQPVTTAAAEESDWGRLARED
jgi:hypothetical protein